MGQQLSKCLSCVREGGARRSLSKESLVDGHGVMMKQVPLHTSPVLNNALKAYLENLETEKKISREKRMYILEQLENITNHRQVRKLLDTTKEPPELRQRLIDCLKQANLGHLVEYVTKPPPANDRTRMAEIKLHMANHYDRIGEKRTAWYTGEKIPHLEEINIYQLGNDVPISSYLDIFQFVTAPVRILIQGVTGIGKSTFLRKVASDWGKNVLYQKRKSVVSEGEYSEDQKDGLNMFDVVLLLDLTLLCDESTDVLQNLVHSQFNFLSYSDRLFLVDYIFKYPERLLLLLDGSDFCKSSEILKIIDGSTLDKSYCIHTANRFSTDCDFIMQKYEIRGFNNEQVASFTSHFTEESDISAERKEEMVSGLRKYLAYTDQSIGPTDLAPKLLRVPALLHIMCISWQKRKDCPMSWTKCCDELLMQLLKAHDHRKNGMVVDDALLEEYKNDLLQIGMIAFDITTSSPYKLTFNLTGLKEKYKLSEESLQLGLLVGSTESIPSQTDKYVTFSHKFWVNYMTAYYVTHETEADTMQAKVKKLMTSNHLSNIVYLKQTLGFICGMNASAGNCALEECAEMLEGRQDEFQPEDTTDLLLFCLAEYSDNSEADIPLPPNLVCKITPDNLVHMEFICKSRKKGGKVTSANIEITSAVSLVDTERVIVKVIQPLASAQLQELHMEWYSNVSHDAYKQLYKCVKAMRKLTSFSLKMHQKHKKDHYFRSLLDQLSHLEHLAHININML